MGSEIVSEDRFIELWNEHRSATKLAEILGINLRSAQTRRARIEKRRGIKLESYQDLINPLDSRLSKTRHSVRRGINLEYGKCIVFSDAHFLPNVETTAYKALLECIKEFSPEVIVCNGDAFDGATISRHARIGWDSKPSVLEELQAVQHYLGEIEMASKLKSNLIFPLGNHDARFETFLASQAPQYEGVKGFTLKDHLPLWQPCWSYWINDDVVIKHRWKGGRYAGSNNTTFSGKNIVTGHTHQLKVEPFTDYNGTRYGVQTGTLACPTGDQFIDYIEDNPTDWRSGFAILTFYKGKLLMPELVQVWNEEEGLVQFQGKVFAV